MYGTQFYYDAERRFGPLPIEDTDHLDERRKAMGLEPFETYEQEMQIPTQEIRQRDRKNNA